MLLTILRIFLSISVSTSLGLVARLGFSEIFTPCCRLGTSFSGTGAEPGIICMGWMLNSGCSWCGDDGTEGEPEAEVSFGEVAMEKQSLWNVFVNF
ncbi:hypothetical protein AAZX31_01G090100 [Glycine max]